jgi:KH domain-containing RNA-binding signal transduction-associated protein 3
MNGSGVSPHYASHFTRSGREERRMMDITRDKPIKVTVRVVVPVRDHPKVSIST